MFERLIHKKELVLYLKDNLSEESKNNLLKFIIRNSNCFNKNFTTVKQLILFAPIDQHVSDFIFQILESERDVLNKKLSYYHRDNLIELYLAFVKDNFYADVGEIAVIINEINPAKISKLIELRPEVSKLLMLF